MEKKEGFVFFGVKVKERRRKNAAARFRTHDPHVRIPPHVPNPLFQTASPHPSSLSLSFSTAFVHVNVHL